MTSSNYTLAQLAHFVQGEPFGNLELKISALASLEQARVDHIVFVNSEKHLNAAERSQASCYIVTSELKALLPSKQNFIVVANAYLAFAQLTHVFESKLPAARIESTAVIHPSAKIAENVYIGHYVVIAENCSVGSNSVIKPHCHLDANVSIGDDCFIDSNVTLTGNCQLQNRVRIHANTVIGSEGFGFAPYSGKWHRIAQLGSVKIGNDVRIGSNCSVDRGALDDTIIEDGVIIDNLVQIAHNVHIGAHSAIAAKSGIAGSSKIGQHCILAGGCGVAGHLTITDHVTLTGMSMVTKSITVAGTYSSGTGLMENNHWKRTIVRFRQLADFPLTQVFKRLDQLQAQLESLDLTLKQRK